MAAFKQNYCFPMNTKGMTHNKVHGGVTLSEVRVELSREAVGERCPIIQQSFSFLRISEDFIRAVSAAVLGLQIYTVCVPAMQSVQNMGRVASW